MPCRFDLHLLQLHRPYHTIYLTNCVHACNQSIFVQTPHLYELRKWDYFELNKNSFSVLFDGCCLFYHISCTNIVIELY